MMPPPAPEHGDKQSDVAFQLHSLLPHGRVSTECPVSTSAGVKSADVAWSTKERRRAQRGQACLTKAPEICVEILSPDNSRREMSEKRALHFEAGAEEVWFCHRDGRMEFFLRAAPETPTASVLCPAFPARMETEI
jgi:Uma2 family endonuclease